MISTEAAQFINDNATQLAEIGITVTAVGGLDDVHIHVDHAASKSTPMLLGDMGAVNLVHGPQVGLSSPAAYGERLNNIDACIARIAGKGRVRPT